MRLTAISFIVIILTAAHASAADPVTLLAKPTHLLFDDDGTIARGGKKAVKLNDVNTVRAWAGTWKKHEGAWRSTWKPGMGHTPVVAYGLPPIFVPPSVRESGFR
jgi:hypothetical protein